MHDVCPAHVHPLQTLGAGVTERTDEQPEGVSGYDGHVVGSWSQTSLMEPLTASHTLNHLTVPGTRSTTVTVTVLGSIILILNINLSSANIYLFVLRVDFVPN